MMADEYLIINVHAFTNKRVARNLAVSADPNPFLNLYKRTNLSFVSYFTTIQVYKIVNLDIFTQLDVGRDLLKSP